MRAVPQGKLEKKYDEVSTEFKRSETRAKTVSDRIDVVANVGNALFSKWKSELSLAKSAKVSASSISIAQSNQFVRGAGAERTREMFGTRVFRVRA